VTKARKKSNKGPRPSKFENVTPLDDLESIRMSTQNNLKSEAVLPATTNHRQSFNLSQKASVSKASMSSRRSRLPSNKGSNDYSFISASGSTKAPKFVKNVPSYL